MALVARRPPLLVSWDAGATWHESGRRPAARLRRRRRLRGAGPRVYAARNRLYLSTDGAPLLALARARAARHRSRGLVYGSLNSPRATVTAEPPTSTDSIVSLGADRPRIERRGSSDLGALLDLDLLAPGHHAVTAEVTGERARPPSRLPRPPRPRRAARTSAPSSSSPIPHRPAPRRGRARRAGSRPASARRRPPSRQSTTYACRTPLSYTSTGSSEAATPSAASSSSARS